MPSLLPGQAVVLQDTIDLTFRHPHSGKCCRIKRTQLPITPAFAMTMHKAQGQTMEKVIIDIEGVRGTEAPYVMVSRVTSLDGLLILRDFRKEKINCRPSEDLQLEYQRLENLKLDTIYEIGSPHEISLTKKTRNLQIQNNNPAAKKKLLVQTNKQSTGLPIAGGICINNSLPMQSNLKRSLVIDDNQQKELNSMNCVASNHIAQHKCINLSTRSMHNTKGNLSSLKNPLSSSTLNNNNNNNKKRRLS